MQGWIAEGGSGPYTGEEGVALFSNPIENVSEGQSKRSREKGK